MTEAIPAIVAIQQATLFDDPHRNRDRPQPPKVYAGAFEGKLLTTKGLLLIGTETEWENFADTRHVQLVELTVELHGTYRLGKE